MRPPRGVPVPKGWVLKLEKGMYGLKQASKLWYTLLNSTLLDIGFRQSVADPCLYIFEDSEFRCTITTWVDDCVVAHNSDERWAAIRDLLSQKFPLSAVSSLNWLLGMDVRQRDGWVELNQGKHIDDLLHAFGMFHCATSGVTTPIVHGTECWVNLVVLLMMTSEKNALMRGGATHTRSSSRATNSSLVVCST